jgi:hypothetical protein
MQSVSAAVEEPQAEVKMPIMSDNVIATVLLVLIETNSVL